MCTGASGWCRLKGRAMAKQFEALTDEELGRHYYNYTNRGWPAPIGWENLSEGAKKLWIERAKRAMKRETRI